MKNIILVGFMGTGKTVAAKALAADLKKTYVSTDDLIEKREKRTINDIFQDDGEACFRKKEKDIVKEVSAKSDQVIDAGGGVVLDPENMGAFRQNGIIICLKAETQVIYERVKAHTHRPLLNVEDPIGRMKGLLNQRKPFYEKADFTIDTTHLNTADVVRDIKKIYAEATGKSSN